MQNLAFRGVFSCLVSCRAENCGKNNYNEDRHENTLFKYVFEAFASFKHPVAVQMLSVPSPHCTV